LDGRGPVKEWILKWNVLCRKAEQGLGREEFIRATISKRPLKKKKREKGRERERKTCLHGHRGILAVHILRT
jgi:hypothetical protein